MSSNKRLSEQQKAEITQLLRSGKSHGAIAKSMGVSQPTVSRLAKQQGIDPIDTHTKKAAAAKRDYDKANRLELLNELFDKGRELINSAGLTPRDYKDLVTGVAIAVDKRRLEDGEASKVTEQRSALDLEGEFKKLDQQLKDEVPAKG